jgi:hypothetical protein
VLQERFNCYCFIPNLVWVESEYSDVQNRIENHWYIEKSLVLFGSHMDRVLSHTEIVIAGDSANRDFLVDYYREYFAPLVSIEVGKTNFKKEFRVILEDDFYLEAMDIRANLLMCEQQYDAATGFSKIIELTPEQTDELHRTRITRGIDIRDNPFSKNDRCHFLTRRTSNRVFRSPNHALRLAGGSTNRR